jgi:hypothetical protein
VLLPAGLSRACTHRVASCWACRGYQATVWPAVTKYLLVVVKALSHILPGGIPQAMPAAQLLWLVSCVLEVVTAASVRRKGMYQRVLAADGRNQRIKLDAA